MVRVGVAAVAGAIWASGDIEGHVEEDREVSQVVQLVAVQEQSVENQDDARRPNCPPAKLRTILRQPVQDGHQLA